MNIKVFKAADLKEAMAMVKDEMGRDAVILHTKRYRQGGFLGYKSKEVVEVTAAVDDTPHRPRVNLPAQPAPPAPPRRTKQSAQPAAAARSSKAPKTPKVVQMPAPAPPRQVLAQYKTAGTEAGVSQARSAELAARLEQAPAEASFIPMETAAPKAVAPAVKPTPVRPNLAPPVYAQPAPSSPAPPAYAPPPQAPPAPRSAPPSPRIIKAAPPAAPLFPTTAEQAAPVAAQKVVKKAEEAAPEQSDEKIQALEDELAQMRKMLRQVMSQPHKEDEAVTLQDALKAQEVNDQVMQDIIRKIPPASLLMPRESEEAHQALTDYLHSSLKTGDGIGLKDGRPKIVALIGTTGVGKTTTIAKIAARFVLERGISVALITADTYRISAVDQLKTYSDIIGLPLEIVYSAEELKPALRKHRGKQLILIDTAGRSQNNDYQMQELKDFLAVDSSIEKHLVLSATTKERDADRILDRFSGCKPDRLLFTKTDETDSLGLIVNLLYDRRIALSYLTNGQSVPDDIEPARAETLAKLLLR